MAANLDRFVLALAALAITILLVSQFVFVYGARAEVNQSLETARSLVMRSDTVDLDTPVYDAPMQSGRVFSLWQNLPTAEPLTAYDFYPNPGR